MDAQIVDINLIPGITKVSRVYASQYDVGRIFKFNLYMGDEVYTIPSGSTVKFRGIKPDRHAFSDSATWSGNVVTVTTVQQETCIPGDVECELQITKSGTILGTANFIMRVEQTPVSQDSDFTPSEIAYIEQKVEEAEQAADDSAEYAKRSQSYAVGGTDYRPGEDTDNAYYYYQQVAGIEMTWAEYQALTPAQKMDGMMRFITDQDGEYAIGDEEEY